MTDCRIETGDALEFLKGLQRGSVDAIITDPPYSVTGDSTSSVSKSEGVPVETQFYEAWLREHVAEWRRVLKPDGAAFVTIDWRGAMCLDAVAARLRFSPPKVGVWDRGGLGMGYVLRNTYECFAVLTMPEWKRRAFDVPDVWRIQWTPGQRTTGHSAEKPVELVRRAIRLLVAPGALICDPFAGSGTTAVAAIEEGCRFIGCERDPAYTAGALARVQAWNGGALFATPGPALDVDGIVRDVMEHALVDMGHESCPWCALARGDGPTALRA